jgi:hypothetical protein
VSVEFVYVIGSEGSTLVKIGRSTDVKKRLAAIQCMSPAPLAVLWQVEGDPELETAPHRLFKNYRAHGEWFDFEGHDPVQVVSDAIFDGLHETATGPIELGPAAPLKHGDVVRIVRPDWKGPRYGVVKSMRVKPIVGEIIGYSVGHPSAIPTTLFPFKPTELRLVRELPSGVDLTRLWDEYGCDAVSTVRWRMNKI